VIWDFELARKASVISLAGVYFGFCDAFAFFIYLVFLCDLWENRATDEINNVRGVKAG
jgi:hypothetical protein